MKISRSLICALALTCILSINSFAGTSHSGRAVIEAAQASGHAGASAAHSVAGAAQVTSGAVAVPLYVSGAIGTVSTMIANELMEAATAPVGAPLVITEETVTAGPPPNDLLTEDI